MHFEGCLPIEEMAPRPRHARVRTAGKPVGLDPATGASSARGRAAASGRPQRDAVQHGRLPDQMTYPSSGACSARSPASGTPSSSASAACTQHYVHQRPAILLPTLQTRVRPRPAARGAADRRRGLPRVGEHRAISPASTRRGSRSGATPSCRRRRRRSARSSRTSRSRDAPSSSRSTPTTASSRRSEGRRLKGRREESSRTRACAARSSAPSAPRRQRRFLRSLSAGRRVRDLSRSGRRTGSRNASGLPAPLIAAGSRVRGGARSRRRPRRRSRRRSARLATLTREERIALYALLGGSGHLSRVLRSLPDWSDWLRRAVAEELPAPVLDVAALERIGAGDPASARTSCGAGGSSRTCASARDLWGLATLRRDLRVPDGHGGGRDRGGDAARAPSGGARRGCASRPDAPTASPCWLRQARRARAQLQLRRRLGVRPRATRTRAAAARAAR